MDMTEYQAFDIGAWTLEGLTRHIKTATAWVTAKRPKNWPASLTLASTLLVTAGNCFGGTAVVAVSKPPPIAARQLVAQQAVGKDLIVGSPQQFWADVAREMRAWQPIDEADDLEIPPFV